MASRFELKSFDARYASRPLALVYGQASDDNVAAIQLDRSTYAITTIDYEHHEVHAGSHFFYAEGITLANGVSQQYLITTPDTASEPHMQFVMTAGLAATFTLDEGADRNGSSLVTAYNSNRRSTRTPATTIHKGTAGGTTDGTEIASFAAGSASVGGKVGGSGRSPEELILARNTKYIFTATSGANANNIAVFFTWYEHTPKE